jgi:AraC-like DNA-binding protein
VQKIVTFKIMLSISTDFPTLLKNIDALAMSFSNRAVTLIIHESQDEQKAVANPVVSPEVGLKPEQNTPKTTGGLDVSTMSTDEKAVVAFHNDFVAHFEKKIISSKEAAATLEMPESRLKSIFVKLYQKPYYQYFLHQRLHLAKKYLEEGRYHVQEVSNILGYSQPIKFVTVFKKHFGVTPGKLKMGKKKKRTSK